MRIGVRSVKVGPGIRRRASVKRVRIGGPITNDGRASDRPRRKQSLANSGSAIELCRFLEVGQFQIVVAVFYGDGISTRPVGIAAVPYSMESVKFDGTAGIGQGLLSS